MSSSKYLLDLFKSEEKYKEVTQEKYEKIKKHVECLENVDNERLFILDDVEEDHKTPKYPLEFENVLNYIGSSPELFEQSLKRFKSTEKEPSQTFKSEEKSVEKDLMNSYLFFKDDLKNIFDTKKTEEADFYLSSGTTEIRQFMKTRRFVNMHKATVYKKEFYITILPYKNDEASKDHCRLLIHLIPITENYELSNLWDDFIEFSDYDVYNAIKKCRMEFVDLSIPKLSNLTSEFSVDFINIFNFEEDQFKLDFISNCKSLITIDEGKEKHKVSRKDVFCQFVVPRCSIKANIPYISFVFDYTLGKIIIVAQDHGNH